MDVATQKPASILIVEDYDDDVRNLRRTLGETGVINPVHVVHSAGDAVDYLDGSIPYSDRAVHPVPGIILLDLKLPGMDGFEFLEWLNTRPQFNDLLVVVISGLEDIASIRSAYALGADSFLTKPCKAQDLENLIQWFPEYWVTSHDRAARMPFAVMR